MAINISCTYVCEFGDDKNITNTIADSTVLAAKTKYSLDAAKEWFSGSTNHDKVQILSIQQIRQHKKIQ